MFDLEFRVALSMSTVSPYLMSRIVGGWVKEGERVLSGFVVEMLSGEFYYITSERDTKKHYTSASTQMFESEPIHLYDRAVKWTFDREKLNGRKEIAKQEANYPDAGLPRDTSLHTVGGTSF